MLGEAPGQTREEKKNHTGDLCKLKNAGVKSLCVYSVYTTAAQLHPDRQGTDKHHRGRVNSRKHWERVRSTSGLIEQP